MRVQYESEHVVEIQDECRDFLLRVEVQDQQLVG